MVGGGNHQQGPFCWGLASWSHSCRAEGGREGFGIVSLGVSMVTDWCRQPTRLGPLSVLSPGRQWALGRGGHSMKTTTAAGALCALLCEFPNPCSWGWESGVWGSALAITPSLLWGMTLQAAEIWGGHLPRLQINKAAETLGIKIKKHAFWSPPRSNNDSVPYCYLTSVLFYLPKSFSSSGKWGQHLLYKITVRKHQAQSLVSRRYSESYLSSDRFTACLGS